MKGRATLENPLLYKKFLSTVERLNPDLDIDPQVIDRTMEYDEAPNFLREIYPNLHIDKMSKSELDQFREYLDENGIDERRVQNLIIQDDKHPYTEDDLNEVSYALHGRPEHAVRVDRAMKAPLTKDVRKRAKKPSRLDLGGIDRPGAQDHHLKARINILADLNACSIKRSCGTVESIQKALENSGKYQKIDIDAAIEAAKDAEYFT
jgi:hypothetical protein